MLQDTVCRRADTFLTTTILKHSSTADLQNPGMESCEATTMASEELLHTITGSFKSHQISQKRYQISIACVHNSVDAMSCTQRLWSLKSLSFRFPKSLKCVAVKKKDWTSPERSLNGWISLYLRVFLFFLQILLQIFPFWLRISHDNHQTNFHGAGKAPRVADWTRIRTWSSKWRFNEEFER